MSVRASLESIFSHLFQEPGLEEGEEGEEDQAAPPLDEAEAVAAAAEAEAAPEAEVEAKAPAEAEAPRPFTPGMGPNPVLHYAKIPYSDRVAEIDEELEQRLIGAKCASTTPLPCSTPHRAPPLTEPRPPVARLPPSSHTPLACHAHHWVVTARAAAHRRKAR